MTADYLPLVEQFYSIQGEGYHTGKAAYFVRIGGCDVGCSWCDTKFAWDPECHELVHVEKIIKGIIESGADSVVVTGGEPLLYDLNPLCKAMKDRGIITYLETSGAHDLSGKWDWICLSPKRNMPPLDKIYSLAGELKVIIENSEDLIWAEENRIRVSDECKLFIQPEWSRLREVLPEMIEYVKKHTVWSISLQSHKYMGIP